MLRFAKHVGMMFTERTANMSTEQYAGVENLPTLPSIQENQFYFQSYEYYPTGALVPLEDTPNRETLETVQAGNCTEFSVPIPADSTNFARGYGYLEFVTSQTNMMPVGVETVVSNDAQRQRFTVERSDWQRVTYGSCCQYAGPTARDVTSTTSVKENCVGPLLLYRDIVHHLPEHDGPLAFRPRNEFTSSDEEEVRNVCFEAGDVIDAMHGFPHVQPQECYRLTHPVSPALTICETYAPLSDVPDPWPHMCNNPYRYDVVSFIQLACGHKFAELGCGHRLVEFRCGHRFHCPEDCMRLFFENHRCAQPKPPISYRTSGPQGCHFQTDLNPCDIYVKIIFPCGHSGLFPCDNLR